MGTFSYDRYVSPYTNNISDLMLRQGEIPARATQQIGNAQANAELARGNAWAGAAQNIGQTIGAIPSQIQQARAQQQISDLRGMQLADAQQQQQGRASVDRLMAGDQLPAGAEGPRPPNYLDADGLFDIKALTQALAASGHGSRAPELLKGAEQINESITKHRQLEQQAAQQMTLTVGDMAAGAMKLSTMTGTPLPQAMDFVVQPALASKIIKPEDYAHIKDQILAYPPEQQKAALTTLMDAAAKLDKTETVAKDAERVDRYGRVVATNVVAEKPTEASLAADLSSPDPAVRARAETAMKALKPGPKQSIEEEWMARDRRLAVAKNGGQPLTDAQLKAVDTASMQDYAQSKADPAMRDAALAQKNIATLLAQAQLNQQPTPEQARSVAEDMVSHRIAPEQLASLFSTRGKEGLAFKLAVTSEAKKLDPTFNFEEASASYNLVKSPGFQNTVRYMDSVLESMPRLLENAKKLGNGDWRSWNQLANAAKGQFNDTDLKRLKTDAVLVGDEVAKILSGGGTGSTTSDAKLKQGMDIISQSDSVPAMAAALDEIQTLIGYRRKAQTRGTYMEGTSAVKPKVLKLVNGRLVPE